MDNNTKDYAVRWDNEEDPNPKTYSCRLKYWINGSGITIVPYEADKTIQVKVFNSQNKISQGWITIPINKIPEIIYQLTKLYNDHATT